MTSAQKIQSEESEEFDLSLFFWNSADLMCIAGDDGYFKKVNPAFISTLGYSEKELLSTPYIRFVHSDDIQKTQKEALALQDGIGSFYFKNRYICKNGFIRHLSWKCSRIGNFIFATARDETALVEAEKALHDSERRLRLLLGNMPLTLFVLDADGNLEVSIGKGIEIAGRRPDENIGKNVLQMHKSRPDICRPIKEALAGRRSFANITYEGFDYEVHYEPVLTRNGLVDHVIGFSMIVTDQKRLQNELYYRQLANSMPQIVWTAQPDGHIDYYNNRWYEFTGLERDKLGDDSWEIVIHPDDRQMRHNTWYHSVNSGDPYQIEYRLKDKDSGNYRWFLGRAVPMRDADGQILRWFGTCTDIQDQKMANDERQNLLDRERAAQEASQLKSQFLANMSHEIRTPLNGVVGMSNLLMQTKLNRIQKEYVDLVVQSADHLQHVVNDILDLSKIESNRLQLDICEIDLKELVTNVYDTLKHSADSKKIGFKIKTQSKKAFKFYGDSIRLRQILLNLTQNAIKFTETGKVEINFSYFFDLQQQYTIRCEVKDTGVGIDDEALKSIFDPFTQADSSITRKFGGTGLGLSICKKLIQLMGGKIGVTSKLGLGSTFYFELPVEAIKKKSRSKPKSIHPFVPDSVSSLHVLVAEDHAINQKVICRILETLGHHADVVSDGTEVINAIQLQSYDLILMDCHMPNMDGFTASKQIRALQIDQSQTPIIALTADALTSTRSKCLEAGMNGYASKPIDIKTLHSEIKRVLGFSSAKKVLPKKNLKSAFSKKALFDLNAVQRLKVLNAPGAKDFALELIEDFLSNTPPRLQTIGEALKAGDLKSIFNDAHALKSAAAAIGAKLLANTAEQLEASARLGSHKKCSHAYTRLLQDFELTKKPLSQYKATS